MSIREAINKKPGVITGATIGVILIALIVILWQQRKPNVPVPVTRAYYTTDDGQTTFEDDLDKPTPFDHNGAQAVRVHMFSCDGGKTRFVGFLEKLPEKRAQTPERRGRTVDNLVKPAKNPSAKWVLQLSKEGSAIMAGIQCPDKPDGLPTEVFP